MSSKISKGMGCFLVGLGEFLTDTLEYSNLTSTNGLWLLLVDGFGLFGEGVFLLELCLGDNTGLPYLSGEEGIFSIVYYGK